MFSEHTLASWMALFPLLLTLGIWLIPVVANYADHDSAERQVAQSQRWVWGHLISAVAFGWGVVAAGCVALVLAERGFATWAIAGLPLVALGAGTMAAGLGADGIGPRATVAAGQSAALFFNGSQRWVVGTFVVGSVLFGLGQVALMIGVQHAEILTSAEAVIAIVAAALFSVCGAVPSGYALYGVALASWVVYLPLIHTFW